MSYYQPQPKRSQKRLPRRQPIKVVPSGIGDQGIVGNWLMYYLKGGNHLHDFSPYNNHGEIVGAKWVDGRYGWALDFPGSNEYVNVPDDPSLDITSEITVSVWVKLKDLPFTGYEGIVSRGPDANRQYWLYGNDGQNTFAFNVGDEKVSGVGSLSEGTWSFLVGTADPSGDIIAYQDGDQVGSSAYGTAPSSASVPLYIGYMDTFAYLNGVTAIVSIYNIVKSAGWVSRRFERTRGIFGI